MSNADHAFNPEVSKHIKEFQEDSGIFHAQDEISPGVQGTHHPILIPRINAFFPMLSWRPLKSCQPFTSQNSFTLFGKRIEHALGLSILFKQMLPLTSHLGECYHFKRIMQHST
ncbi:MAG: hypothetical protein KAV87_58975 [Desulfobacteraceae bacterium]|nr:hypothetical protein [Desulfobacteraceae bacterium]